jgi:hypothetical protein
MRAGPVTAYGGPTINHLSIATSLGDAARLVKQGVSDEGPDDRRARWSLGISLRMMYRIRHGHPCFR